MVALDERDRAVLDGAEGPAAALALRLLVRLAEAEGAPHLIDVSSAHIDACLYHGRAGLDLAQRMVDLGARVAVPTTLNVASLDLRHPGLYRGDAATAVAARALMDAYVAMGARPTWTCAPYQLMPRPAFGQHVAWGESNAIVFANSVLGARTDRYGDFSDLCCALTGRAPFVGLHRDEHRRGEVVFDVSAVTGDPVGAELVPALVGHVVGDRTGAHVPVVVGLAEALGAAGAGAVTEDDLRALGAAAASSGSVGLFHAVGVTPEAPTLEAALAGGVPLATHVVTDDDLAAAVRELRRDTGGAFAGVSLGTPHASESEARRVADLLEGRRVAAGIACYLSMGRDLLDVLESDGTAARLVAAGVTIVTDTCTYVTPIVRDVGGLFLTNSAKWAYYAPANIGVDVAIAPLPVCLDAAVAGRPPW